MILAAIVVCEIAFWVFLVAGLLARYVLRRRGLGAALLLASPFVDLALLVLIAVDLHRGADPTQAHAMAAAYIGVTVAWGHSLVRWADQRVAYRFASGPPPDRPPKVGPEKVRYEWREFGKAGVFWLVSCLILLALAVIAGDVSGDNILIGFAGVLSVVIVIWFATGPLPAIVNPANRRSGLGVR